ncbi:MAG: DUF3341 domain-containing protein [Planctomycetes bacterium]|jgi:hypothetical protein|nr:DUF3341 domain-containing protein [Planctomycetota bacterium]
MSQVTTPPQTTKSPAEAPADLFGVLGEYDDVTAVVKAARAAREAGYRRFDVHAPFPIHGIDGAIGIRPTILPWIVLLMGLVGMATGFGLTIFTMSDLNVAIPGPPGAPPLEPYPFLISGKPFLSIPAYIPPIFELTILLAAFGAVFGMFLLNKLPLLYHPLLKNETFKRATSDRFILVVESRDRLFDPQQTRAFLKENGALSTEEVEM